MSEQKIYISGMSAKEHCFASGHVILKIGVHVDRVIEQLQRHRNEKGYVNLCISKRRETGKYGDTHCVWLDTWKPKQKDDGPAKAPEGFAPAETCGEIPF